MASERRRILNAVIRFDPHAHDDASFRQRILYPEKTEAALTALPSAWRIKQSESNRTEKYGMSV